MYIPSRDRDRISESYTKPLSCMIHWSCHDHEWGSPPINPKPTSILRDCPIGYCERERSGGVWISEYLKRCSIRSAVKFQEFLCYLIRAYSQGGGRILWNSCLRYAPCLLIFIPYKGITTMGGAGASILCHCSLRSVRPNPALSNKGLFPRGGGSYGTVV